MTADTVVGLVRTPPAPYLAQSPWGGLVLWMGVVAALVLAMRVIALASRRRVGRRVANATLAVGAGLALLIVLELGLRLADLVRYGIGPQWPMRLYSDALLGWPAREVSGDASADRPRVLVIGDSFTEGHGVPEEDLYFSVMGRVLGWESFGCGGGGYGTLQELMLLDRHLEEIRPTMVLLQLSPNDLINNEWPLETASLINNNLLVRPYLIGDRVEYRYPGCCGRVGLFLSAQSRLWYHLRIEVARLKADLGRRGLLETVEARIEREGLAYPPFAGGAETTRRLLRLFKQRAAGAPLRAFVSHEGAPFERVLTDLCDREGIPVIAGVAEAVRAEEAQGRELRQGDGAHWNARGHDVVGRTLARALEPASR